MPDDLPESSSVHSPEDASTRAKSTRFRFKTTTEGGARKEDELNHPGKRHRHHHSSHHRSKRRRTSTHLHDDPSIYDSSVRSLPSDQAFRESLFDALGDDEGAGFWEGVYGQPIHNYPNTYVDKETGEVETMNDEQYAQYVRRKMWEKSWEGIEAAKEEKRRERDKEKRRVRDEEKKQTGTNAKPDDFIFDFEIEASLRRGERRKDRKRWQTLWEGYLRGWAELQELARSRKEILPNDEQVFLRNKIAWPVESGKRKDVSTEAIEAFIKQGATSSSSSGIGDDQALATALKLERVRWHPDKMQQRYGFMQIDDGTMQGVTAVFQVFDRMWNEMRQAPK